MQIPLNAFPLPPLSLKDESPVLNLWRISIDTLAAKGNDVQDKLAYDP